MADIKFGTNQLNNPTPSGVNLWVRIFTIITGVFLAWTSTTNLMGPHSKDVVNQLLGLAILLSNGLAPLFGIEISGNAKIPISKVSAADTDIK